MVASCRLPDFMPWYTRFASHAWIDLRDADGDWQRVEVVGAPEAPAGRAYRQWPGPNSNTFIAWVIERTPGLSAELDHNAVGKDYPDGFRVGRTSAGWGVEVETALLGAGVGLSQGVELHLLGLTAGIDVWPPAIKLPFLPRLGFGY